MTISIRTLITISVTALLTSGMTVFVAGLGHASASPAATYPLRVGDYVGISALDWTCSETMLPRRGTAFLCTTNDKPISEVAIYRRQVVVNAKSASGTTVGTTPVRIARGGYLFHYNHD